MNTSSAVTLPRAFPGTRVLFSPTFSFGDYKEAKEYIDQGIKATNGKKSLVVAQFLNTVGVFYIEEYLF